MTATLAGAKRAKRGHDSQVVALVDVTEIRLGGLDRERDLEGAPVELARDAEPGVLEYSKHLRVVGHHLGDEPLDAGRGTRSASCSSMRVPILSPGARRPR